MKLLRLGPRGEEKPAVLFSDAEAFDVSSLVSDFDPPFFANGGVDELARAIDGGRNFPKVRIAGLRVGAPVARPGKLLAVGKNYADHAKEMGASVPERPIFFDKATSAINGPYDEVVIPSNYATVDYEVELALVIGKRARRVARADALAHVAGYLICNDVSERTAQIKEGGQWYRGKSFDTFAPLGPYLVTPDEVPDPHHLELTCRIDSEVRQRGNTSDLIFDIPTLLEFMTRNITLEPGDILTTGTPSGVGIGMSPPGYLKPGQVAELEITGLGRQRTAFVLEAD
jgi:2,4-diketo-3-deoxy-L-fuconate hydrolase